MDCRYSAAANKAENKIKADQTCGPVRVGALESMAASRLPLPLARLYKTYLAIELGFSKGICDGLYQSILDGHLDAILISDAPQNSILNRTVIFDEELLIITPLELL